MDWSPLSDLTALLLPPRWSHRTEKWVARIAVNEEEEGSGGAGIGQLQRENCPGSPVLVYSSPSQDTDVSSMDFDIYQHTSWCTGSVERRVAVEARDMVVDEDVTRWPCSPRTMVKFCALLNSSHWPSDSRDQGR